MFSLYKACLKVRVSEIPIPVSKEFGQNIIRRIKKIFLDSIYYFSETIKKVERGKKRLILPTI